MKHSYFGRWSNYPRPNLNDACVVGEHKNTKRTGGFAHTNSIGMIALFALFTVLGFKANAQLSYWQSWEGSTLEGWSSNFSQNSNFACDSTKAVRKNIYSLSTQAAFTSPMLGISNGGQVTLTFQYRITDWSPDTVATPADFGKIEVQWSGDSVNWQTIHTIDSTNHTPSNLCASVTPATFAVPNGNVYLRFNCLYYTGDYYMRFDAVSISQGPPPACPQPSAINATAITSSGATIGWTENGSATQWDLEYGATGFIPGNGMTTNTTTNPHALTSLSANTSYDVYVRANCTSDSSLWSGPFTFTTATNAVTIPYTQNFEGSNPLADFAVSSGAEASVDTLTNSS